MKRLLIIGLLLVVVLGSVACGSAQAATQNTAPATSATIQDLQKQINALQTKVSALERTVNGAPSGSFGKSLSSRIDALESATGISKFSVGSSIESRVGTLESAVRQLQQNQSGSLFGR